MNRITLLLAEDHNVMREGLRLLLDSDPELSVVGETGDGLEAVALTEQLQPNVLILDLMLPGLSGLEVTRQVHQRFPDVHILILSMYDDEAYVQEALRNGAIGYVLKGAQAATLMQAIRMVAAGQRYLCPPLAERAIQAYAQQPGTAVHERNPYDTLTTREREILHLSAEGQGSAEIAARLSISPRTVENHRASLMRKLHLHSQTDLVRYALRRGLIR